MISVAWRPHLRRLPELGCFEALGDFEEADDCLPFLMEALELPPGGRVLDLGCGRGSFSVRLAQWGYRVTAVEESGPLLEAARRAAAAHDVEIEFRQGDLRNLPERGVFHGALMLDFGTLPDADNAAMIRAVAAALKPGGRVVFVVCNPYYWCRAPHTTHHCARGMDVIRRYRFDLQNAAVVSHVRCILPGGERRDLPAVHYRAYTLPELRALVAATGLADLRVCGQDEAGRPRPDRPLDGLATPFFHGCALKPVTGEGGEGI